MSTPITTPSGAVTKLPRRIVVSRRPARTAALHVPPRNAPVEHRVRDWMRRLGPRT